MNLVIVESPAKAKTINKYLGKDFTVLASYGHIRDLPSKNGSVDPDNQFKMIWEIDSFSKKYLKEITDVAKESDKIILATDPDREGEAIAWHVKEFLDEKKLLKGKKIERVVFNEITKKAVTNGIENPREIEDHLVDAYMARRALDYLVGFNISPILWTKLPGSKSAGRVQSVALRIISERELEIEKFIPQEYWSLQGEFRNKEHKIINSRLTVYDGNKVDKLDIKNEGEATKIFNDIKNSTFTVGNITKKEARRNPYPAFTTSTMQIESSRKLGLSASQTMRTAQRLYEGTDIKGETTGLITYMRTDSVVMSKEAINQVRGFVTDNYGANYLPDAPRVYKSKAKNAQEAHECIRPTNIYLTPKDIKQYITLEEYKLYEIIWQRAVSSQMASAVLDQVAVDITNEDKKIVLRANGSTIKFPGMYKVYQEAKDDDKDEEKETILPAMSEGESLNLKELEKTQHFTSPPPRYTEASLVKKLEELGIGRPSTYASIIKVLQDRDYVILDKKRFNPHDRGRIVSIFLEKYFNQYVEYDFTADLENQLDEISDGKLDWKEVLRKFWETFKQLCDETVGKSNREVIDVLDEALGPHFFPPNGSDEKRKCPTCDNGRLGIKVGKFGGFIGCSNYPDCKYTVQFNQLNDKDGAALSGPKEIGIYPETGEMITLRKGPYGFYMQVGEGFVVNILREDNYQKMFRHFLKRFAPGADRFADVDVISNIAEGGPVLSDSLAFLDCKVSSRLETPDHWIIYGIVENGNVSDLSCKTAVHHRKVANHY